MADVSKSVHVTFGVSRADSIRGALRLEGCEARVIALSHALSIGPIDPLDAEVRRAWFAANLRADDELCVDGSDPEAPWMEATSASVHPIYWVCLTDAAEHACFLEFATRMAGRPFDIVDATGSAFTGNSQELLAWSLGQLRPEEILASGLGRNRRLVSRAESDAAVAAWSQLRRENAPLRIVRDGHLVSAPLTHFDPVLVGQATPEWQRLATLISRTLHHLDSDVDSPGQGCSYELLFARILALGEAGALEVTGPGPGMRDYDVRLPAGCALASVSSSAAGTFTIRRMRCETANRPAG
jgi:hypothetical protein